MIREVLRRGYRTLLPLLYSRSQYKAFLKVSLGEVDLRLQQLASATDLFSSVLRAIPIRAPFGSSMLVIAPHQDDEIIGCGGALASQVASGRPAHVVVLQDGADGHEDLGMRREQLIDLRNSESRAAAAMLGIPEPRFLQHASLAAKAEEAAAQVAAIVRDTGADAIFAPFPLDGQADHRTANYILADALKAAGRNIRVFGYEVWGLCIPNVILVIDDVIEKKMKMLECFHFANQALDYVGSTRGLNMYRSRMLGAGVCKYAECFFEAPRLEYIELVERIRARERAAQGT